MSNDTPQTKARRNGLVNLPKEPPPETDSQLTPFAQVAVHTDRICGRPPRFHEGMSLEDAVIITGLPHDEAARRIQAMKKDGDPEYFAAVYLSAGAGQVYSAKQAAALASKKAPAEPPPTAEIIQFPLPFGEETRAVSNPLARCAMFAAINEREYFKEWVVILDTEDLKIEMLGEQLNQDDKDTFCQLIKMGRHKPFGERVSVPVNAVLAGLGRHTRQSQRNQLFDEVERAVTTSFRIKEKGKPDYICHLIDDATTPRRLKDLPQHQRNITYRINPNLAYFFSPVFYTLYDQQERLKLGRNALAKWLYFWVISHAEQYPHKVETIRQKCGSRMKDLKEFRKQLRRALDVLKEAGVITAWHITHDDLVLINRTPSAAQLEHLTKKGRKKGPK